MCQNTFLYFCTWIVSPMRRHFQYKTCYSMLEWCTSILNYLKNIYENQRANRKQTSKIHKNFSSLFESVKKQHRLLKKKFSFYWFIKKLLPETKQKVLEFYFLVKMTSNISIFKISKSCISHKLWNTFQYEEDNVTFELLEWM